MTANNRHRNFPPLLELRQNMENIIQKPELMDLMFMPGTTGTLNAFTLIQAGFYLPFYSWSISSFHETFYSVIIFNQGCPDRDHHLNIFIIIYLHTGPGRDRNTVTTLWCRHTSTSRGILPSIESARGQFPPQILIYPYVTLSAHLKGSILENHHTHLSDQQDFRGLLPYTHSR